MLELAGFLYIVQLFLLAMAGINIVIGIATFLADGERYKGSKMVFFGMLYAFASMACGLAALSLLP